MKALRSWIEKHRMTQAEFARRVGVTQPTISGIVRGVHSPSLDLLRRITKETGLSADDLLSDKAA